LTYGITLMRPPVVKRQTIPMSGFFLFSALLGPGDVGVRCRVLT
jgi:hypothetical protein